MSKPQHHPLRSCPECNGPIRRGTTESWPTYNKKTACSTRCAALLREEKDRAKALAAQTLAQAMLHWKAAE